MKNLSTGHRSLAIILASGLLLACQISSSDVARSERTADSAQGASTADLERTEQELESARAHQEAVAETLRQDLGSAHPETLVAIAHLIEIRTSLGDVDGGRPLFDEILALPPLVRRLLHALKSTEPEIDVVSILGGLGEFGAARANLEELLLRLQPILGREHDACVTVMGALARVLFAQKATPEAIAVLERIGKIREESLGAEHQETLAVHENLAQGLKYASQSVKAPGDKESFDRARSAYLKVLDALERGSESTFYMSTDRFTIRRSDLDVQNHEAVDHMLDIPNVDAAFEVLERTRATSIFMGEDSGVSLLARLHETGADRSETTSGSELQKIGARVNAITRALDRLDETGLRQSALLAERSRLQGHRHKRLSSQLDDSAYTIIYRPVTRDIVRESLDPGTVLLSYNVGPEHTDLFVVVPQAPTEWHRLPVSAEVLRSRIEGFAEGLGLHQRGVERIFSPMDPEARTAQARWLFDTLIAPAGDRVASAKRLLILPGGPLHRLPFAALMRPAENGRDQYLVEWKPIHLVQSLAAYIELRGRRPEGAKKESRGLLALGGPAYPGPHIARRPLPLAVRSALRISPSAGLQPLPNTAREVSAIGKLFARAAEPQETLLAANATEEAVKQRLGRARYIHLAVHGFADDQQPDHSFLALSIPEDMPEGRENGILEIWEIIDQLHFDADLATLSACVTALGPEYSGEGLMSLSRAFQIAGARSVLASLWRVDDESTAELMIRFYRHLLSGMSKDEALRTAQSDLIRGPIQVTNQYGGSEVRDFTAPYYWAAFQLFGDWQ